MSIFKKSDRPVVTIKMADTPSTITTPSRGYTMEELFVSPKVCGHNYMQLFRSIPEVFFPIDYIASRIANREFQLKKKKDDSIVWENKRMNQILTIPNTLMSWNEFIYQHFVYRLCTGNSFVRAAMSDTFTNAPKWQYCSNFWVLPSDFVEVEPVLGRNIPMFGIAEKEELIKCYRLGYNTNLLDIPVFQIWHDRDGAPSFMSGFGGLGFMKAHSRLESHLKNISNLMAVYEARNVIYVKRGGLGYLVSNKQDDGGTAAMTDAEKKDLLQQNFEKYGIGRGQIPYGLSDVPLSFVRTNLSISELQPFEETLTDAIQIAGAYGIPSVLVPRKDQSTFNNQASAEKSVYTSIIIPMAKEFCKDLTQFLGLESGGYYLDCDFSDVDCLQQGMKEAEEVKTLVNTRCEKQFLKGLITINDWRAQIGESQFEEEIFNKTLFHMSEQEREFIRETISLNTNSEVENGRNQKKPSVQNEGK